MWCPAIAQSELIQAGAGAPIALNTGLPIFMVGQFLLLSHHGRLEWLVGTGAAITFVGLALFAVNLMRTLAAAQRAGAFSGTAGSARP